MPQLRYEDPQKRGFAGMLASSAFSADVVTGINDDPRAAQIVEFGVTTAATEGDLTLNSVEISGAGADQDAVAADIAANINANPLLSGAVFAEAATDTVTVTARVGGIGFTFEGGANTTATETQANAEAAALAFGRAVLLSGEDDDGNFLIKLIDANSPGDVLGISMYTATTEKGQVTGLGQQVAAEYPGGHAVNVCRAGRIYVEAESEIDVGDDVYVRHTADGALDQLGVFAGGAGTGLVELPGCRWVQGTRDDGIAVLQLNLD